jgi:hypothetical protein
MSSRNCPGLHCDHCGKGGISAGAILVIIGIGLAVADSHAIGHAITEAVQIAAIILAALAGLAITSAAVAAVIWIRRAAARTLPQSIGTRAQPGMLPSPGPEPRAITAARRFPGTSVHGEPVVTRRWPS